MYYLKKIMKIKPSNNEFDSFSSNGGPASNKNNTNSSNTLNINI